MPILTTARNERDQSGNAASVIQRELDPQETLLWSGCPKQGLLLRRSDLFAIPFSLLWGGFAMFWEFSVWTMPHTPVLFRLWGVPFVGAGLYLIFGRFFADAQQRSRTFYGLSSDRVIIVSGLFHKRVQSLPLRNLSEISVSNSRGGAGTLVFGPTPPWTIGLGGGWPGGRQASTPRFDTIDQVQQVYQQLRAAQKAT